MEDEKFRQELDELFRLFKKLVEEKSLDDVPGIDKTMLQQFQFFFSNYENMKDQIAYQLQGQFGEPVKEMVKTLVKQLKEELGKTPSLIHLQKKYGDAFVGLLAKRFRSYINVCSRLEMEAYFSKVNPKYSREYFIEKALSNPNSEKVFDINESRAIYKYIKGGMTELNEIILEVKT